MSIAYLLVFSAPPESGDAVRRWFEREALGPLCALHGLVALDLYTPDKVSDPYLDDGAGPAILAHLYFEDVDTLLKALGETGISTLLRDRPGYPPDATLVSEVMEARLFPVAGEEKPSALTAPASYVVRYHRPATNEEEFIAHYVAHHPPILGRFPRIRNVICYLPTGVTDPVGLPDADYMLGNEVVFDSIADLDAALNSPVRHELRDDYKTFPPFDGRNTHYAMNRRRIAGD